MVYTYQYRVRLIRPYHRLNVSVEWSDNGKLYYHYLQHLETPSTNYQGQETNEPFGKLNRH
jgi:hypothetical protein